MMSLSVLSRGALAALAAAGLWAQSTPATFATGQAARHMFGQPTFTAQDPRSSESVLGAVSGLAYANDTLFVVDSNRLGATPINNRVLIYRNLSSKLPRPTDELLYTRRCPACTGAADQVLGQPDFKTLEVRAAARNSVRQPNAVATDGVSLAVADTDNNRVLIWNTIPQSNNAPADVVVGQPDFTRTIPNDGNRDTPNEKTLRGPQGVWLQNGRLFVADTGNNRILIWNSIPRANFQSADIVIGQPDFRTLVPVDITKATLNAQNNTLLTPVSVTSDGQRMLVADLGHNRVLVWSGIPRTNNQAADLVVGQPDFTSALQNNAALCPGKDADGKDLTVNRCEANLNFPRFALSDGRFLFVSDGGNDRILVFNSFPAQNGAKADAVLGQIGFRLNLISDSADPRGVASSGAIRTPQALAWDGRNLYAADPFNRRVMVFTLGERRVQNTGVRNAASKEIFAVGAITFGGTIKEGDEATIKIGDKEYKYKLIRNDTFDNIITNVVRLINAGQGDPRALATPNTDRAAIILTSRVAGAAGNDVEFSTSVSTNATLSLSTSGAKLQGGQDAALIAPGTIVSIFGERLSEVTVGTPADATQLPLELGGVQVYFDGIRAPIVSVSPEEVRAQVPWEFIDTESANAWVRTQRRNGEVAVTSAVAVPVVLNNPGIFTEQTDLPDPRPGIVFHGSPAAVGTVSVDGSIRANDIATVVIEDREYNYTVQASDSKSTVRDALIARINASDPRVEAFPAAAFDRIRLRARQPGPDGNGIRYSARSREGDQVILTATTSALCCANSGRVTEDNPAVPGENIVIFATGLGLLKTPEQIKGQNTGVGYTGPELNDPNEFVSSLAAAKTANVLNASLRPGSIGIFEVVLELNSDIPTDPKTQLTIAQDIFVSNIVTFPVVNPNQEQ